MSELASECKKMLEKTVNESEIAQLIELLMMNEKEKVGFIIDR